METDLLGGKCDFLTKEELDKLEKAGLISRILKPLPIVSEYYSTELLNEKGLLFAVNAKKNHKISNNKKRIMVCSINMDNKLEYDVKIENKEQIGIVPVIRFDKNIPNQFIISSFKDENNILTVKFGRYLYSSLPQAEKEKLEREFSVGNMISTGGCYRISYDEYIYDNKYYARYDYGKKWVEVKDIEWILDENLNILICKNILSRYTIMNVFNGLNYIMNDIIRKKTNIRSDEILLTQNEEHNLTTFVIPPLKMIHPSTRIKTFQYKGIGFEATQFAYLLEGRKASEQEIISNYNDALGKRNILNHTIRPVVNYDYIKDNAKIISSSSLFDIVIYGEYLTSIAADEDADNLEYKFIADELNKTGKSYHLLRYKDIYDNNNDFEIKEYPEYEYNGNKYVRLDWQISSDAMNKLICDLHYTLKSKNAIWVKVEELKWIVDKETNMAISEKDLLDLRKNSYLNVDLNLVHNYLKKYFSIDIVPSKILTKAKSETLNKVEETETTGDNIMLQIIVKKYNLMSKKEKIEKIKKVIEGNEILQRLMEKNNLIPADIGLDENDNPIVRGLRI